MNKSRLVRAVICALQILYGSPDHGEGWVTKAEKKSCAL